MCITYITNFYVMSITKKFLWSLSRVAITAVYSRPFFTTPDRPSASARQQLSRLSTADCCHWAFSSLLCILHKTLVLQLSSPSLWLA